MPEEQVRKHTASMIVVFCTKATLFLFVPVTESPENLSNVIFRFRWIFKKSRWVEILWCLPHCHPLNLSHLILTWLQVTCCALCSTPSVMWLVMACRPERFTRWCTTTTRSGLSQYCCWTRCLGIYVSTSTPSPSPARERTTSPVSHFRQQRRMHVHNKLL